MQTGEMGPAIDPRISLRQFLTGGGDLSRLSYLDQLARAVLVERRRQSAPERLLVARWCRERVRSWAEGRRDVTGAVWLSGTDSHFVTALQWQAECLEDPQLAKQFERALALGAD